MAAASSVWFFGPEFALGDKKLETVRSADLGDGSMVANISTGTAGPIGCPVSGTKSNFGVFRRRGDSSAVEEVGDCWGNPAVAADVATAEAATADNESDDDSVAAAFGEAAGFGGESNATAGVAIEMLLRPELGHSDVGDSITCLWKGNGT